MADILVIEDEESILMALEDDLTLEGYMVTTATDGETGFTLASEKRFDLLILDIILPGMIVVVTAEIATRSLVGDMSAFTAMLKIKHQREAAQREREKKLLEEQEKESEADSEKELSEADEIIHDNK